MSSTGSIYKQALINDSHVLMVEDNWKNEWVKAVDANGGNYSCNAEQVKKITGECKNATLYVQGTCDFTNHTPAADPNHNFYDGIRDALDPNIGQKLKCFSNQDCNNYIPNEYCRQVTGVTGATKATCHGAFKPRGCNHSLGAGNGFACDHDSSIKCGEVSTDFSSVCAQEDFQCFTEVNQPIDYDYNDNNFLYQTQCQLGVVNETTTYIDPSDNEQKTHRLTKKMILKSSP